MKKVLILTLLCFVLSGCSNLGEIVECHNNDYSNKRTNKVVGETNKRTLIEEDSGRFRMIDRSERNNWDNCVSTEGEKLPPKMLSGYDSTLWDYH